MSIVTDLQERGINVVKSDVFVTGVKNTNAGIKVATSRHDYDRAIWRLMLDDGQGKVSNLWQKKVYIEKGTEYEGKITDRAQAEKLTEEGKIYSFETDDLYAEVYGLKNDEELACAYKHRYTTRSRRYIENEMESIGMTYWSMAEESDEGAGKIERFEVVSTHDWADSGTCVGQLGDRRWIAQTLHMLGDSVGVHKMFFNHQPTEEELMKAFTIYKFDAKRKEYFTCWSCGRVTHWLDCEGDLMKKFRRLQDAYCGC